MRWNYNGIAGATNTYRSIVPNFPNLSGTSSVGLTKRVYTAGTSLYSIQPHPSTYPFARHNPHLFGQIVTKVVQEIKNGNGFSLLRINNVSEWAESGLGLQLNKQDGYGYLSPLKSS